MGFRGISGLVFGFRVSAYSGLALELSVLSPD